MSELVIRTKQCMPFDPGMPLLGHYTGVIKAIGKGPICTKIFIAVIFVVEIKFKL